MEGGVVVIAVIERSFIIGYTTECILQNYCMYNFYLCMSYAL